MKIKITATLLILSFLNLQSFSQDSTAYPLKAEARIVKQGYYPYVGMELFHYSSLRDAFIFGKYSEVELKIINTSNKTVYFWAMTCSWAESLLFDNLFVMHWRWVCDSNFPVLIALKPGDSKIFKTTICFQPQYTYTYLRIVERRKMAATKLGFIIIGDFYKDDYSLLWRENAHSLYDYGKEKKNQKAIIWSNSLNFL